MPGTQSHPMCRVRFIALFILLALSATFAEDQKSTAEQQVVVLKHRWAAAQLNPDAATLNQILADGYVMTNASGQLLDKAAIIRLFTAGDPRLEELSFEQVKARVHGNTAVLTARMTTREFSDGATFRGTYVITYSFVKHSGTWQAVSSHFTLLQEPPLAKR